MTTTPAEHPPRLAASHHAAGTGRGCAMDVVSWIRGDTTITDAPECVDPVLAGLVQRLNDTVCDEPEYALAADGIMVRYLCPDCSTTVLPLALRTMGTAGHLTLRDWAQLGLDFEDQHGDPATRSVVAGEFVRAYLDGTGLPFPDVLARSAAGARADAGGAFTGHGLAATVAYYDDDDLPWYMKGGFRTVTEDVYTRAGEPTVTDVTRVLDLFEDRTTRTAAAVPAGVVDAAIAAMTTTTPA